MPQTLRNMQDPLPGDAKVGQGASEEVLEVSERRLVAADVLGGAGGDGGGEGRAGERAGAGLREERVRRVGQRDERAARREGVQRCERVREGWP